MSDIFSGRREEPLFLVPWQVLLFAGVFVAIYLALMLAPAGWREWAAWSFVLVPSRFLSEDTSVALLSGANLATYGFIHYDWLHLVNIVFLLIGAGPVMRNCGSAGLWLMFILCVVAGGLVHVAAYWGQPVVVAGSSGGAAGLIAASLRYRLRKLSQGEIVAPLSHQVVALITGLWVGLNLVFFLWEKIGGMVLSGWATTTHIGGYLAGLLLAPLLVRGARAQTWPPARS